MDLNPDRRWNSRFHSIDLLFAEGLPFHYFDPGRSSKVPEEYVKSAVTGSVEDRLSTIKQQILSRTLLTKIIDRYGLYKEGSQQMVTEEIIEMMRKKIEVKTVGRGNVEAFSLSFEGTSPVTVMEVTNQLASLFIEENLKIREQLIEEPPNFSTTN